MNSKVKILAVKTPGTISFHMALRASSFSSVGDAYSVLIAASRGGSMDSSMKEFRVSSSRPNCYQALVRRSSLVFQKAESSPAPSTVNFGIGASRALACST